MLAYYIKTHHILLQDVHFAELSISDFYYFITWAWLWVYIYIYVHTYHTTYSMYVCVKMCFTSRAHTHTHLKKTIHLCSRQAKWFTHQPIFYWLQQIDWTIGLDSDFFCLFTCGRRILLCVRACVFSIVSFFHSLYIYVLFGILYSRT